MLITIRSMRVAAAGVGTASVSAAVTLISLPLTIAAPVAMSSGLEVPVTASVFSPQALVRSTLEVVGS